LARQAVEERERWVLWVPVFIGAGIAVYFGLASEPPIWLGAVGLVGAVALRLAFRRWPLPATLATCLALGFLGLAAAQLRVALVSAPFLPREIGRAAVEGRVCEADLRPNGYRLYPDDVTIADVSPEATPQRVRVSVGKRFSPESVGKGSPSPRMTWGRLRLHSRRAPSTSSAIYSSSGSARSDRPTLSRGCSRRKQPTAGCGRCLAGYRRCG
jgi:hypothetical protein